MIGLVLAGGFSRRMGWDKASLQVAGQTLLARSVDMLKPHCRQVLVSVRNDQINDPLRCQFDLVIDPPGDIGPVGGLLAAWDRHPNRALLLVACDMPWLDAGLLEQLIGSRDRRGDATVFIGERGHPEPLCAIWEYRCYPRLAIAVSAGRYSPLSFLQEQCDLTRVMPDDATRLRSVNRPEDLPAD